MSQDKTKASWDVNTTKVFIDLCIEQVKKGERKCTSFTKPGWNNISESFTAMTGRVYSRTQFKNKYDSLRKEWQMWDRLLRETGVGWDNERQTVTATDEWWERKILEVPTYEKFRLKGLQFQVELTELFGTVAATGPQSWAPSSMVMPNEEPHVDDVEEGSGDSDEVLRTRTGVSDEFNSVTLDQNSGGSGGTNRTGQGTSSGGNNRAGQGTSSGVRTTSSLGVRRSGDVTKKKGLTSKNITNALNKIADTNAAVVEYSMKMAEEAHARRMAEDARRMAEEAHAYEISIAGVITHLKEIDEVVFDRDFYRRCIKLLMDNPPTREMFVALKDDREQLLLFLRHECYGP